MFTYEIKTRYNETGQDGIIHHSSYAIYFEVARLEFFKNLDCDINVLEKAKIFCPLIDLSIKYIKPLHCLENIVIEVSINEFSKVVFKLDYKILKDNVLISSGFTSHCFTNGRFKPVRIPAHILEKFKSFKRP